MKDSDSKIVMIDIDMLDPHPSALKFWANSDDRKADIEAITASVSALMQVRNPLVVMPKSDGSGYWVIDGCTRLQACRKAGLKEVKCEIRIVADDAIDDEVYVCNMTRSRFGTGLRVIRYLENHIYDVLKAARENADFSFRGAKGGRGNIAALSDNGFSTEAIAKRLGVSQEDVMRGVELMRCKFDGLIPDLSVPKKRTLLPAKTEEQRKLIDEMYVRVTSGETPLRKWAAACGSKAKTEGKAKNPANYAVIGPDSLVTLKNTFIAWQTLAYVDRERVLEKLSSALEFAPDDVTEMLRKRYAETVKKAK